MRWREPMRSAATRTLPIKPRVSSRPSLVTAEDNREILGESGLEGKAALVLMARPACRQLFEQPDAVSYLDLEGIQHKHTFDFMMVEWSGRRIAVAVKPFAVAERRGLKSLLGLIARQMDPAFATGVLLLTDVELRPDRVQNGRLVNDARRLPDADVDRRFRAIVATLQGSTTIDCLIRAAGLHGHDQAFYAAARAIGDGWLVPCRPGLIVRGTPVRPGPEGGRRP